MDNMMIIWLTALVGLVGIEIFTLGLTTVWFAAGALGALAAAMLGLNVLIQAAVFLIISTVLLFTVRPISIRYFNHDRAKTNVEALIGKRGIALREINNIEGTGIVRVGRQEWTARAYYEDDIIPVGHLVEIKEIEGVKLLVTLKED